jgi:hypothetical protein
MSHLSRRPEDLPGLIPAIQGWTRGQLGAPFALNTALLTSSDYAPFVQQFYTPTLEDVRTRLQRKLDAFLGLASGETAQSLLQLKVLTVDEKGSELHYKVELKDGFPAQGFYPSTVVCLPKVAGEYGVSGDNFILGVMDQHSVKKLDWGQDADRDSAAMPTDDASSTASEDSWQTVGDGGSTAATSADWIPYTATLRFSTRRIEALWGSVPALHEYLESGGLLVHVLPLGSVLLEQRRVEAIRSIEHCTSAVLERISRGECVEWLPIEPEASPENISTSHVGTHQDRYHAAVLAQVNDLDSWDGEIALLQGPPGTGKTTVVAQVVENIVRSGERSSNSVA